MALTLNSAAVATWLGTASHSAGTFTIPSTALVPTLAGATGATIGNDIRLLIMGLLDKAYNAQEADKSETNPVAGTDYPSTISISRAVTNDKVQFVVSINTSGTASLPTYG